MTQINQIAMLADAANARVIFNKVCYNEPTCENSLVFTMDHFSFIYL